MRALILFTILPSIIQSQNLFSSLLQGQSDNLLSSLLTSPTLSALSPFSSSPNRFSSAQTARPSNPPYSGSSTGVPYTYPASANPYTASNASPPYPGSTLSAPYPVSNQGSGYPRPNPNPSSSGPSPGGPPGSTPNTANPRPNPTPVGGSPQVASSPRTAYPSASAVPPGPSGSTQPTSSASSIGSSPNRPSGATTSSTSPTNSSPNTTPGGYAAYAGPGAFPQGRPNNPSGASNPSQPIASSMPTDALSVASSIFKEVPIAEIIYGVEALRQSSILKNFGVTYNKHLTPPVAGTPMPKGQCYLPTNKKKQFSTPNGGFTVCLPATSMKLDFSRSANLPRLGHVKYDKNVPEMCQASLMSKNSPFDGYYCVTSEYSNRDCGIERYQLDKGRIIYEAILYNDTTLNNAIIRCMLEWEGGESSGKDEIEEMGWKVTTDVTYEVSVKAMRNSDSNAASQTAEILSVMPALWSGGRVGKNDKEGADEGAENSLDGRSREIGNMALDFVQTMVTHSQSAKNIYSKGVEKKKYAAPSTPANAFSSFIRSWNAVVSGEKSIQDALNQ